MTMPGAPCIYYGDEIGLSAGDDPHCREAFPWDDEARWHSDLRAYIKEAIQLRASLPALRTGTFEVLHAQGHFFTFRRQLEDTAVIVAFNAGTEAQNVPLPLGDYTPHWPRTTSDVISSASSIRLAPRDAVVLVAA